MCDRGGLVIDTLFSELFAVFWRPVKTFDLFLKTVAQLYEQGPRKRRRWGREGGLKLTPYVSPRKKNEREREKGKEKRRETRKLKRKVKRR